MLTLRDCAADLRAACARNNFQWLRAMGCRVEAFGPWWRVWHDQFPEYRALVVLREAAPASAREVEEAVNHAALERLAVYLDAGASADWKSNLEARGYAMAMQSIVRVAGEGKHLSVSLPMRLRRLFSMDADVWTALYMQVFDRSPALAEAERTRWRAAFDNPCLQHYLCEHDGAAAGIFELCLDDSVAGLYSVGFLAEQRTPRVMRQALQMIRHVVWTQKLQVMYFERTRSDAMGGAALTARRVVRLFDAWVSTG